MKNLNLVGVFIVSIGISWPSRLSPQTHVGSRPFRATVPTSAGAPPGKDTAARRFPIRDPVTTSTPPRGHSNEEYGRCGNLFNGPHNEDRDKFKADTVYFDFDSATIKAVGREQTPGRGLLFQGQRQADALIVEGNCDERGTEKYNLSLGERRALAVREYLANLGMDPHRIKTVTYGASKPVDPGHNEAAWKKNRRGDLVLVTPK